MSNPKYNPNKINPVEITPEPVYINRRKFMQGALVAGGALLLAACVPAITESPTAVVNPSDLLTNGQADELGDPLTPYDTILNYNNFYEFSLYKERVAAAAKDFKTDPWQIEISGLVESPVTLSMDDVRQTFTQEERIYRLRCVEGWSMVIPWIGFRLSDLLNMVKPTAAARYVRFESLLDPDQFPNPKSDQFPWPYTAGWRLDEAMNDLTILATGLYGKALPPQDGAPIRLVVPWKYGFKSIKSIVKIELTADQPRTLWQTTAPHEYGFYANVNPAVSHPRWSQESERRIGENGRRETLLFNGYADEVASLYEGMDLKENY
jgi:sulfoxide reductase catalytic subunit YedY